MKISTSLLLLIIASQNTYANYISHVYGYMSKKGVSPVVLVGLSVSVILVIGIVVYNEIRKADKFNRTKAELGWNRFYQLAKSKGMGPSEQKVLEKIAHYNSNTNIDIIFTSSIVFENCLEAYYQKEGSKIKSQEYAMIRKLREFLGYNNIPMEVPYTSSRQFQEGMHLNVILGLGWNSMVNAKISRLSEAEWVVSYTGEHDPKVGDSIRLSLTRSGDAEYTIETEITSVGNNSVTIAHSRRLVRQQLRNWVRIEVAFQALINCIVKDVEGNEVELEFSGKILDISGGGVSFQIPEKLKGRATVKLTFDIPKYHFKEVEGVVARVDSKPHGDENLYKHCVEFVELDTVEREKIVRFVFDKQRQDSQWR